MGLVPITELSAMRVRRNSAAMSGSIVCIAHNNGIGAGGVAGELPDPLAELAREVLGKAGEVKPLTL